MSRKKLPDDTGPNSFETPSAPRCFILKVNCLRTGLFDFTPESRWERLEPADATRQGDYVPEGIYWNWESGIRDHQGDVNTMRMF